MGKIHTSKALAVQSIYGERALENGVSHWSVFEINFMVKLLRACVGMPRRKKAMKDVASCEKLRGDAHSL